MPVVSDAIGSFADLFKNLSMVHKFTVLRSITTVTLVKIFTQVSGTLKQAKDTGNDLKKNYTVRRTPHVTTIVEIMIHASDRSLEFLPSLILIDLSTKADCIMGLKSFQLMASMYMYMYK